MSLRTSMEAHVAGKKEQAGERSNKDVSEQTKMEEIHHEENYTIRNAKVQMENDPRRKQKYWKE